MDEHAKENLKKVEATCKALMAQTMNYLMTGDKKDDSWKTDGIK